MGVGVSLGTLESCTFRPSRLSNSTTGPTGTDSRLPSFCWTDKNTVHRLGSLTSEETLGESDLIPKASLPTSYYSPSISKTPRLKVDTGVDDGLLVSGSVPVLDMAVALASRYYRLSFSRHEGGQQVSYRGGRLRALPRSAPTSRRMRNARLFSTLQLIWVVWPTRA